ncbi:HNH endonuclease [Mycolicibacterium boenickei]|nr:HNH endonuclease [Mycolicibacterium boenickei]
MNTRAWRKLAARFKAYCESIDAPCWLCREPIDYGLTTGPDAFEPDHWLPRKTHPHLAFEPKNLLPSHSRCNRARQDTSPESIGTQQEWVRPAW